jgi:magnesium transporter
MNTFNSIVDAALYRDGQRIETAHTLGEMYQALRSDAGAMAWIELQNPSDQEVESLAREFEFHDLLLEDIIQAHQRPKLERYESNLFVVLHAARYKDRQEEVEFAELHVIIGPNYIIT